MQNRDRSFHRIQGNSGSGWTTLLRALTSTLLAPGLLAPGLLAPAQAQSIIPAAGGTGSLTTTTGNQITIQGGQRSGDGTNLFHSFSQFNLNQGQIANFLSTPSIQNILARVVGGNASYIDGLIRVTGGNSNLYLMNPAGIVFGANASLNVPASFLATTANGIGFGCAGTSGGCENWFGTAGATDYRRLNGLPAAFAFSLIQPGSIVNAGNLAVGEGQALSLVGGVVINTGSLTAPRGQITIAAVPGQNLVRLTQPGSLLSLEFQPFASPTSSLSPPSSISSAPTLPQLLTGGNLTSATGVTVNADGTVQLTGSGITLPTSAGTAIASGQLSVVNPFPTQTSNSSPSITVAGKTVGAIGATLDASGSQGGTIRIGGDYQGKGPIPNAQVTVVDPTSNLRANGLGSSQSSGSGGKVIVWADDTTRFYGSIEAKGAATGGDGGFVEVSGKQTLVYRGQVDTSATAGLPGTLLLDPENIRIVAGASGTGANDFQLLGDNAIFAADPGTLYTISQGALESAVGNIRLEATNNIEIASLNLNTLSFGSSVVSVTFQADSDNSGAGSFSMPANFAIRTTGFNPVTIAINGASITAGDINTAAAGGGGDVFLTASRGNVTVGNINTSSVNRGEGFIGGAIAITSSQGSIFANQLVTSGDISSGSVTLNAPSVNGKVQFGSISTVSPVGFAGDGKLVAGEFVEGTGFINGPGTATINTTGALGAGLMTIQHGGGVNAPFVVGDKTPNGTVGSITTGTDSILPRQSFPGNYTAPGQTIAIVAQSTSDRVIAPDGTIASDPITPLIQNEIANNLETQVETEFQTQVDSLPDLSMVNGSPEVAIGETAADTESEFTGEFEDYLDIPEDTPKLDAPNSLQRIQELTGVKPALVYVAFVPSTVATVEDPVKVKMEAVPGSSPRTKSFLAKSPPAKSLQSTPRRLQAAGEDQLELLVVTAQGRPIRRLVAGVTRDRVKATVQRFLEQVTDPRKVLTKSYLPSAQQLYRWLVAPLEAELQARGITNLAFISDAGLRFIPMAALHDGKQFLVEKYSMGLMPSLSLTDTRYGNLKNAKVLAMGASEFTNKPPLPAVPAELSVITQKLWQGRSFLNQDFTLANLKAQRQREPFQIIHLATHGEFQPGALGNSYIQLWDTQLQLNQMRQLGWNNPPVELLVLSACRTAFGNDEAELGFAGFAVQAGVKTALASLWYVSDEGTLGLMTEFYRQLETAPVKAAALQQAQIRMLKGEVQIRNGKLIGSGIEVVLPPELAGISDRTLAHPYYWSAFTMIGSPW